VSSVLANRLIASDGESWGLIAVPISTTKGQVHDGGYSAWPCDGGVGVLSFYRCHKR